MGELHDGDGPGGTMRQTRDGAVAAGHVADHDLEHFTGSMPFTGSERRRPR